MRNPVIETKPKRLHVIPLDDVTLHAGQKKCWCHPCEREPGIWVHNAKDAREAKERDGIITGKSWATLAEF